LFQQGRLLKLPRLGGLMLYLWFFDKAMFFLFFDQFLVI
jgi:hypothetical protein